MITTNTRFEEHFLEDVLSLVTTKPMLVSDLIAALRDGYPLASKRQWRNVNKLRVMSLLREYGAHLRWREHGAGAAVYVAALPFTTVVDGRGKTVEVHS